ncbi:MULTISPECIES: GntR family transcriptional regulator [Bosea]|jgi:GntR family transcriptional regulator|uniref:GntR family transcriptional regulator n=1 Tax=Bosea TaxID=85413 RepID=UPI00214FF602|nr:MULTISPECIES: GntR family transcriptional regulator [Bosea]MCR4522715.1 GntR family transcriptional regulator [Bosea sp. 47.2.35]MDR6826420.1 GntR family transcriptional regulator [Bosea robiniae]MDR6893130.1 GntR family transcriptional regulator [Bosea sp. BE109]MDR7137171.1 GntR family transcriptional regulator [Bosea sp. BE168]MDR7173871.1 GntR family transcriptional regulator [Bosea sp. BE271]
MQTTTVPKPLLPKPPFQDLLELRSDTAKPLYQQLEDQLSQLIGDGTLPAGTTLPAERQLAERLSISRATVQRSYNALRERKLLSAQGRLGSIVQGTGPRLHSGMDRLKGFTEEMKELGRVPSSRIVERSVVNDRSIASIFGRSSHARFLKLVRIRSGDDIPMSREVAWYNLERAPDLAESDLSGSVYARLAALGLPLMRCDQTIEAAAPTVDECAIFGFAVPVPCLLIKRRSYGADGDMLEYVEGLFRGDTYTYKLTLTA